MYTYRRRPNSTFRSAKDFSASVLIAFLPESVESAGNVGNDNLGWQTIERQQPKANQNHMFHVFTHMFHCLNIHLKSMLGNTARWLEANSSWQLLSRSRTMWNLQRPRKLQRREASKNKLQRSHQHYDIAASYSSLATGSTTNSSTNNPPRPAQHLTMPILIIYAKERHQPD